MIFVTVGTTLPFDALIRQMDQLVQGRKLTEPVVCQIGKGTYEPEYCEHFRFRTSLDELFERADLVVTHGGITVLSLLARRKKFVAVSNDLAADQHQLHFLERLEKVTPILWTSDISLVEALIGVARTRNPDYAEFPSLADDLRQYLDSL